MPRLARDRKGHFLPRRKRSSNRRRRNSLVAGGSYYSYNRPRRRRRNKRGVPLSGRVYRPRIGMSGMKPLQEYRLGMYTSPVGKRRKRRRKAANSGRVLRRRRNRRHRRNWGAGYSSNPRRRRNRRGRGRASNPGRRRRYNAFRHRRSRNPGLGSFRVSGFMANLRSLMQVQTWVGVGQAGLGFSVAIVLPRQLAKMTGKQQFVRGWSGVAASAASAALGGAIAGVVSERAARNVFIGGLIATLIRIVGALSPTTARDYLAVPMNGATRQIAAAPHAAAGAPAAAAAGGGVKGLGRLVTPEQLIAGESRSRGLLGVGDWVELRGMSDDDAELSAAGVDQSTLCGLGGYGQRVPSGSLRGMNDWMEFNPSAVAQAGGTATASQIPSFTPSSKEVF